MQAEALATHRVVLLGESTHGTAEFYHAPGPTATNTCSARPHAQCWLDLRGARGGALDDARNALRPPRQERFIGVIYRPETELPSH
ncbi:hypothetical protein [Cupriavidus sp. AcVe19-6a]|uniref:hypothetical protein n=1 Tax=Cupriavidus sp. AcVe19-6a TaxID=2821358 RepID=UPI001FD7D296|nr:hypothetical protein [Cupriavidus sp. AcVe19-6a]